MVTSQSSNVYRTAADESWAPPPPTAPLPVDDDISSIHSEDTEKAEEVQEGFPRYAPENKPPDQPVSHNLAVAVLSLSCLILLLVTGAVCIEWRHSAHSVAVLDGQLATKTKELQDCMKAKLNAEGHYSAAAIRGKEAAGNDPALYDRLTDLSSLLTTCKQRLLEAQQEVPECNAANTVRQQCELPNNNNPSNPAGTDIISTSNDEKESSKPSNEQLTTDSPELNKQIPTQPPGPNPVASSEPNNKQVSREPKVQSQVKDTVPQAKGVFACDVGTDSICMHTVVEDFTEEEGYTMEAVDLEGPNGCMSSYIGWTTEGERLVGEEAKRAFLEGDIPAECTVSEIKRLMGLRYSDKVVQQTKGKVKYQIRPLCEFDAVGHPECDKPVVVIPCLKQQGSNRDTVVTPEEITAMLLQHAYQLYAVQSAVGVDWEQQVISGKDMVYTVPAYFIQSQRESTQDAANIANFNTIRILNEPTAASIHITSLLPTSYWEDVKLLVVFDFGGGTLDVSVLNVHNVDGYHMHTVTATHGVTDLGGMDFDSVVMNLAEDKLVHQQGVTEIELRTHYGQLKLKSEQAKIRLSTKLSTKITLMINDRKVSVTITRSEFNVATRDLVDRSVSALQKAIQQSGFRVGQIDVVATVGGSSYIPAVRDAVANFFSENDNNVEFVQIKDPMVAVAKGAAKVAGWYLKDILQMSLADCTSQDFGIRSITDDHRTKMSVIVPRGTMLPTTPNTRPFMPTHSKSNVVNVQIVEGYHEEYPAVYDLGNFSVSMDELGVSQRDYGTKPIDVTFQVAENGILEVTVRTDKHTEVRRRLSVLSRSGRMTGKQILISKNRISTSSFLEVKRVGPHWEVPQSTQYDFNTQMPNIVDIVICIDVTSSMSDHLTAVKQRLVSAVQTIKGAIGQRIKVRVAIIAYRDTDDTVPIIVTDLDEDIDSVVQTILSVEAMEGGDWEEDVPYALSNVFTHITFADNSIKRVFLVGDAPEHSSKSLRSESPWSMARMKKMFNEKHIKVHSIFCSPPSWVGSTARETSKKFFLGLAASCDGKFVEVNRNPSIVTDFVANAVIQDVNTTLIRHTFKAWQRQGISGEEICRRALLEGLREVTIHTDQGDLDNGKLKHLTGGEVREMKLKSRPLDPLQYLEDDEGEVEEYE